MTIVLLWLKSRLFGLFKQPFFWYALIASAVITVLIFWHNARVDAAVKAYKTGRDKQDAQAVSQAQGEAKLKSDQHAAALAVVEKQAFEQGKTDEKIIADLRADVRAGRVRMCEHSNRSSQRDTDAGRAVTASDAASPAAASGAAQDSERVIRLGEIGLEALNRWEEAQGIIKADHAAVNGEKDDPIK